MKRKIFKSKAWLPKIMVKSDDPEDIKNFDIESGLDYKNLHEYAEIYSKKTGNDFWTSIHKP